MKNEFLGMISGFLKKLRITDCKLVFFRCLHLQEYQSKELLRDHGLAIQRFITVGSAHEAAEKFRHFKASEYVVKAQILAGGRGKGHFSSGLKGGVKLTRDQKEAVNWIKDMIGHNLVTKQTPTGGVKVQRVKIHIFSSFSVFHPLNFHFYKLIAHHQFLPIFHPYAVHTLNLTLLIPSL